MDLSVLERIGLSKAEIQVYLSLLELGSSQSGALVKQTGFFKSTVYDSLKRLQEKGLVSYVLKNGMKQFEAQDPEKLLDYVEDQKRAIEKSYLDIHTLAQELKKGYGIIKPHAEAHVLEGIEGFKAMRRDVLKHAHSEHLLLGAISRENEVIEGFFADWNKQRQKLHIHLRILHKESARDKRMSDALFMGAHFETRFLPREIENPAIINIYGDRVVNVLWRGKNPLCFMLINQEIADSYRKYFEYLWQQSM